MHLHKLICAGLLGSTIASGQVLLTWDDNSAHEDSFRIERAPPEGDFATVGVVGANVTRWWDRTGLALVPYRYQVRAVAGETVSAPSNAMEGTTRGRVANMSMRGWVGRDDALMIGGTFLRHHPVRLLVRVVGPTLARYGVPDVLAAPRLTVLDAAGNTLATAGAWGGDPGLAAIMEQVGAFALPPDSADAALTLELPTGGYTFLVRGTDNSEGVALVELYEVN